jgi:hypothetical protein
MTGVCLLPQPNALLWWQSLIIVIIGLALVQLIGRLTAI